jgi:hypothetical protein
MGGREIIRWQYNDSSDLVQHLVWIKSSGQVKREWMGETWRDLMYYFS